MKANAQSVMTTLGGGNNKHLGLVLNGMKYAKMPGTTLYVRPLLLTLSLTAATTSPQIGAQKKIQYGKLRLFEETNLAERVLLQLTVSAIDTKYPKALRNSRNSKITGNNPTVLEHLLANYGDITKEEL